VGRKKLHPSATARANRSVEALKTRGGARKTWRLSPEAHAALNFCMAHTTDKDGTALVNRLLLEEKQRLSKKR
jgi:hypothetical protein